MKQLLYWTLCVALLAGCSKEKSIGEPDEPDVPETPAAVTLELSAADLVFEAAGGEKSFTVTCNGEWTITNESDWCTTDVTAGTGDGCVAVYTGSYRGFEDRNLHLTVKSGDKTAVLTVTQKYGDAIVPDKAKFEVPQAGGDLAIKVRSNVTYDVTIPKFCSSWIQPAPETRSEVSDTTYRFLIGENEEDESRTGYIIFSSGSVRDTVRIYQAQQNRLVLTQREYKLPARDTTLTVELRTNVDYEMSMLGDGSSWIHVIETRVCRVDRLQLHIEENNSGVSRTAKIVVRDKNGELSDTLTLRQFDVDNLDELDITDDFDPEFAKRLEERGYIPDASHITLADVKDIDSLNVSGTYEDWKAGKGLTSLAGIEYFESLTYLDCRYNQLTSLDVSKNTVLEYLWCYSNQLTFLEVSQNAALTILYCSCNQLTSLDVSQNTALISLYCDENQLTSLDVCGCTALKTLWCSYNSLTSLDVSGCTVLKELTCNFNQLASLDVSGCTVLDRLDCIGNHLTSLNVSKNTALTTLICNGNHLTSLNVSLNTALKYLHCAATGFNSLDVSKNTALVFLDCRANQITSLDVSRNTALISLYCYENQLTSLDVSGCTALEYLNCHSNQLISLDVSGCTVLYRLDCYCNQLTSLDVSRNAALTVLECSSNQLTSLDVSGCTALEGLRCYFNQLTSLDVSGCSALEYLNCHSNQLTSLDVSKNTALTMLYCYNNPGDGESLFPVMAWFDNSTIPGNMEFTNSSSSDGKSWTYGGKTIRIDFRKAE